MLIKSRILIVFPAGLSLELRNTMHGLYSRLHENILLSDSVHAAKRRRRRRWKKKQEQKCFNCYFVCRFPFSPYSCRAARTSNAEKLYRHQHLVLLLLLPRCVRVFPFIISCEENNAKFVNLFISRHVLRSDSLSETENLLSHTEPCDVDL